MIYTPLALATAMLSSIGSALMVVKFCRDWRIGGSSVRWLFTLFFGYLWVYITARAIYYCWLADVLLRPEALLSMNGSVMHASGTISVDKLDRLGIHAILYLTGSTNGWVLPIVAIGDTAHFGATIWVLPLIYELSKLVSRAMDRGVESEQAKIRVYAWVGHGLIAVFALAEVVVAVARQGYSKYAHWLLLSRHLLQIVALLYMVGVLLVLKRRGRNREAIHGQFIASPLYRRLKWMMIVYAVFAFQFNLTSLVIFVSPDNLVVQKCLGTSVVIYNATVFALAIVTGCSLPCVTRCCRWCLPVDLERTPKLPDGSDAYYACGSPMPDNAAPTSCPVFVFTDIESSSALWAIDDGRIMQKAVQIHDDILRAALTQHRGYEITTAGDAFQLAFHTIREAATYCLDVQTRLLTAKWPKELHGLVPATTKERHAHRYVFRGLRVRMGIHDAAECEGRLVVDVHAVTGKTTYTGTSEAIASTVGDLGAGGQIVVTRRVAEWLEQNRELVGERFEVAWLSDLVVPQVNVHVELSQLLPAKLAPRKRYFGRFDPASRLQQSALRVPSVSCLALREALVASSQSNWQPPMRVERLSAAVMV